MYAKHAELKAGLVVLAAILAVLALLFFATGADLFSPKREVHIRFQQGFAAPREDDPVYLNGVQVGRIKEVVQREEIRRGAALTAEDRAILRLTPGQEGEARELYVLAVARLHRSQVLPRGTTAEISESLTGTRRLSMRPGRSLENLSDADTHQNPIPGRQAGDLGDIMRDVQALVRRVTELVESGQTIFADVRATIQALHRKIEAIEATEISANVRDATAVLKATLVSLQGRFDTIAADVAAAVVDVKGTAAEARGLAASAAKDVPELIATLNRVAGRLDELIARTAPEIDAIVADLRGAAANVRGLTGGFDGVASRVETLVDDAGVDVRRTFARLAEVGRNLQDASEDIKAHPWKLLNKPDEQEIAYENLRTAAQSMVRSAQIANEMLPRIAALSARTDLSDADKAALREQMEELKKRLDDYDAHAARMNQMLRAGGGPPGQPQR